MFTCGYTTVVPAWITIKGVSRQRNWKANLRKNTRPHHFVSRTVFFLLISGSSGLVLFSLAQLCKLFFFLNLHFYTVKILQRILLGEIAQHLRTVFVIHKFDPSRKYSKLEPLSSNKKKNWCINQRRKKINIMQVVVMLHNIMKH